MNWNKVDLDLDVLKHQPRDIHEETGLFEHIFCLLSLPMQITPAALAETQQQQKATQAGGFPTNLFQNNEHLNAEDIKKMMSHSCVLTQNCLLSLQRKLSWTEMWSLAGVSTQHVKHSQFAEQFSREGQAVKPKINKSDMKPNFML